MLEINTKLRDVREVSGDMLDHWCSRGYQLVCVLQEKNVAVEQEEFPCPGPPSDNSRPCPHGAYHPTKCWLNEERAVIAERVTTKYVVGRDPGSVAGELADQVESLQKELEALRTEYRKAVTTHKEAEKTHDQLQKDLTTAQAEVAKLFDEINEHKFATKREQKIVTRFKNEIEKLRTEFGAREVRRVLEA